MRPIIILPPNTMSAEDIATLRENDLCVVVSEDPSKVKFVDPIPAISSRTEIESAAIKLSRCLLNGTWQGKTYLEKQDMANLYVQFLIQGTPLDKNGSTNEQEERHFNREKQDELSRLAREEARAERSAAKAAKQSQKK